MDRHDYVNVLRFYIYAERGLARRRVSIWLYEGRSQIAYREAPLARYAYPMIGDGSNCALSNSRCSIGPPIGRLN